MPSPTSGRPTRMTDPTLPISVRDPIRDDNPHPLWLVPGDWTRGRALAFVAEQEGEAFTRFRAHRTYLRWEQGCNGAGWRLDDGVMAECSKDDRDAERYWTVKAAPGA